MNALYLIVDLAAILVPLIASFHPRIGLNRFWPSIFVGIMLSALPFLIWDSYFTGIRVWGFTPKYLLGVELLNLPIEEVLFFICIPYACLFTYFCFRIYLTTDYRIRVENALTWVFMVLCVTTAAIFHDRQYTFFTALFLGLFLLFLKFIARPRWLSLFYYSHMFLLAPFVIVNGILTGTGLDEPIVWYNNNENLEIRILTIPVEDIFYGMLLLLLNTFVFEHFIQKVKVSDNIVQQTQP